MQKPDQQREVVVTQPPPANVPPPSPTPPSLTPAQAKSIAAFTKANISATPQTITGGLSDINPASSEQDAIINSILTDNANTLNNYTDTNLQVASDVAANNAANQDLMNEYQRQLAIQAGNYNYNNKLNYYQNMPQIPTQGPSVGSILGNIIPAIASNLFA